MMTYACFPLQAQKLGSMEEYLDLAGVPADLKAELMKPQCYDQIVGTYLLPYTMLDMYLEQTTGDNKDKILKPPVPISVWDPSRKRSLLSDAEKHDASPAPRIFSATAAPSLTSCPWASKRFG